MRALLWRLFSRETPEPPPATDYRAQSYAPLRPWQVRNRRFTLTRRGLDPAEVNQFLDRVAVDLTSVYAELTRSREETMRIKDALREWQSQQAPTMRELARLR